MTEPIDLNIPLSPEVKAESIKNGTSLFRSLRNYYPNDTIDEFDIILNTLCYALACLRLNHTKKGLEEKFNKLVYTILENTE